MEELFSTHTVSSLSLDIIDANIVGEAVIERFHYLHQQLSSSNDTSLQLLMERCETLLLYAWQELNTGKWIDVNVNWHKLYAAVSWLKAAIVYRTRPQDANLLMDIIKICDMGHLMGGDVWDDILIRTISLTEKLNASNENIQQSSDEPPKKRQRNSEAPPVQNPIPTKNSPPLIEFLNEHLRKESPVVLTGVIDDWPALSKWSPEYVKKTCGFRTVPVEIGRRYTDNDWGQKLMTISEFIDKYVSVEDNQYKEVAYLAQHDLFAQAPSLRADIWPPDYIAFSGDDDPDLNAWFGPAGTVSPLHQDPKHNLLCQVVGEKYIRLYDVSQTKYLYPHESQMLFNTSQVDVENPDLNAFPDFSKAVFQECILRPGDVLYIPPKCWHYVRSLSVSFSVSFWFDASPTNEDQ